MNWRRRYCPDPTPGTVVVFNAYRHRGVGTGRVGAIRLAGITLESGEFVPRGEYRALVRPWPIASCREQIR